MRTVRALFAVAGLAALAWGGLLAFEFATGSFRDAWQGAAWLVGGPVIHDAVVAPIVGVIGLLIARHLPPPWQAPVAVGAVSSGVLVLLAIPLLWQPFGVPVNPGLHDRNYWLGLGISLAVVWVGVAVGGLIRTRRV
ncbi:hypothetical protein [Actinokineospora sp.]|uniref:hypothetical protein n=1 Tax=Actinokineospora sp. TaxID=1872133 RepID=UPI004037E8BB